MDKKAKKRIDLLQQKLQKLRLQLAGAKKQLDDPADVKRLEAEIAAADAELRKLKESSARRDIAASRHHAAPAAHFASGR